MEAIKEYIKFIKERINESFFPEEKVILQKGLKLMKLSLPQYIKLQMKGFSDAELKTDSPPEIDLLTLPSTPIAKKLAKMPKLSKADEIIMNDFAAVQLTISIIMFEYFRRNDGKEAALNYAKYMMRSIDKLRTRIGEESPAYVNSYASNMTREIKILEEEIKNNQSTDLVTITQEELERYQQALHYLKTNNNQQTTQPIIQKTVHKIHFEDYSGEQFERLTFAYVLRHKNWDKTPEWLGQAGSDSGRDIWAVLKNETYCYACANYQTLTITKAKSDIDKLKKKKYIPNNLIIVCGGVVSANLREKIIKYGKKAGAKIMEVWSGVEFEEKLRHETPELIKRFFEGEAFPYSPGELIKYNEAVSIQNDTDIINLLAECFDRPAFTTPFYRESSIPEFEKAMKSTIEVLNTGIQRLNDGIFVRTIASRHKIKDEKLKSELALITELVVKLRDTFTELKRTKEIQRCNCDQEDCSTYILSDNACRIMDDSRKQIFEQFQKIKPNFKLQLY